MSTTETMETTKKRVNGAWPLADHFPDYIESPGNYTHVEVVESEEQEPNNLELFGEEFPLPMVRLKFLNAETGETHVQQQLVCFECWEDIIDWAFFLSQP